MGYTHYWYRPLTINDTIFHAISEDFGKTIRPLSDAGIELAGSLGQGPTVSREVLLRTLEEIEPSRLA